MSLNLNQHLGSVDPEIKAADGRDVGPSVAWRTSFDAQLTPAMMVDVTAYAARRASWIEQQTGIRDPMLADEMVQNAIGDTFAQVVKWAPARRPLALHLKSVIRGRCAHELERAETYERIDVDTANEIEVSTALAVRASSRTSLDACIDELVARLRALADGDEPVLRLLELYLDAVTDRRDVCRRGPMSNSTHDNAVRRLARLFEDLPSTLIASAREAWGDTATSRG